MHLPFSSTLNFIFVEFATACCVEFCCPANECLLQSITVVHASKVYILRQTKFLAGVFLANKALTPAQGRAVASITGRNGNVTA